MVGDGDWEGRRSMSDVDCDVAIVGYGPVGQVLGGLLARAGHSVVVTERYAGLFPLPRAIRFDGEVMRIFQRLEILAAIQEEIVSPDHYLWFGADGRPILDIDTSGAHPSGWREGYAFFQPVVEAALDAAARRLGVDVQRGWNCEGVRERDDHVELQLRRGTETRPGVFEPTDDARVLRARYVVGADGANSFVRRACGIEQLELGFAEQWLVADVRPYDMASFDHLPVAAQYCDPTRPTVVVRNGARHRRWEFMLMDGEIARDFDDPSRVWALLSRDISPDQGTLIRSAVYEFRSLLAESMRAGRVLLAGDSAHLMPPFMGEGMCSGLRDANNLAWRLDLILRGVADDALLDTYTPERRFQNEATVRVSIEMGKVSCTVDPRAAAARDAAFRAGDVPPPPPLPGLGPGVLHLDAVGAPDPVAGTKAVQGRIERGGRAGLLDDVLDAQFVLVATSGNPRVVLGDDRAQFLEQGLRAAIVSLDPAIPDGVHDVDGALTTWLQSNGLSAVIVRPDAYAFGGVEDLEDLPALVDDLRRQLSADALTAAA
jgi:2-polyprenyl-6-methoxyphenol hydroxylase-like FAD-dependent oxidoreductase